MAITKDDVKDFIRNSTVLEISQLVQDLEEEFGVSAQAPMAVAAAAAPGAAAEEAEQTEFNVVLIDVGDKKIPVVKEVKNITGKDLKESKTLVDKTPSNIVEKVSKEKAEEIKEKLEAVGASVEIK